MRSLPHSSFFFFNDTATTEIYTLSLHDALPICMPSGFFRGSPTALHFTGKIFGDSEILLLAHAYRSEEHTSELQSRPHLVCRLLLEKKKKSNTSSLAHTCCKPLTMVDYTAANAT